MIRIVAVVKVTVVRAKYFNTERNNKRRNPSSVGSLVTARTQVLAAPTLMLHDRWTVGTSKKQEVWHQV
jgi:hypothetical protein